MKRRIYFLFGVVCAFAGVLCLVFLFRAEAEKKSLQAIETTYSIPDFSFSEIIFSSTLQTTAAVTASEASTDVTTTASASLSTTAASLATTVPATAETTASLPEPEPYESPVDFELLHGINTDIYGWLNIPGTDISYPLLQSEDDDTYYMNHGADGSYYFDGSLFTQRTYNTKTFDDPVTVIYGHRMGDGEMFNDLQSFFTGSGFSDPGYFSIYLEDKELHYRVFAAIPYDRRHLLYSFDFSDEDTFNAYFRTIANTRTLSGKIDASLTPVYGDKVVILETCLRGNSQKRFLVMGKLVETYN